MSVWEILAIQTFDYLAKRVAEFEKLPRTVENAERIDELRRVVDFMDSRLVAAVTERDKAEG